mmetsp:Transcript_14278/g.41038  ORF Transcript_14278/g.41038 Transcript_14278/m.41038 type:complete len:411 (+) Transcript_14278:752-1984(+)
MNPASRLSVHDKSLLCSQYPHRHAPPEARHHITSPYYRLPPTKCDSHISSHTHGRSILADRQSTFWRDTVPVPHHTSKVSDFLQQVRAVAKLVNARHQYLLCLVPGYPRKLCDFVQRLDHIVVKTIHQPNHVPFHLREVFPETFVDGLHEVPRTHLHPHITIIDMNTARGFESIVWPHWLSIRPLQPSIELIEGRVATLSHFQHGLQLIEGEVESFAHGEGPLLLQDVLVLITAQFRNQPLLTLCPKLYWLGPLDDIVCLLLHQPLRIGRELGSPCRIVPHQRPPHTHKGSVQQLLIRQPPTHAGRPPAHVLLHHIARCVLGSPREPLLGSPAVADHSDQGERGQLHLLCERVSRPFPPSVLALDNGGPHPIVLGQPLPPHPLLLVWPSLGAVATQQLSQPRLRHVSAIN